MKLNYSTTDYIGRIELFNPPYNTLDSPVFGDYNLLKAFLSKEGLKAVVVEGAGRNFCAGADIESLKYNINKGKNFKHLLSRGKKLLDLIRFAPIPVIALIRGSCLGAGLEIALSCHFRWASNNAMFGFPETENQILPGLGGTVETRSIIKIPDLIELVLSGKMIGAAEAEKIGIIDRSIKSSRLEEEAIKYIKSLVHNRTRGLIEKVMKSIHNGSLMSREKALKAESLLFYKAAKEQYK